MRIVGASTSVDGNKIDFDNDGGAFFLGDVAIGAEARQAKLNVFGTVKIGSEKPIGTHADSMLSVDGKIVTKSIAVTIDDNTNWADFVFKEGYKLTPLLEVEKHIAKEGHLKGIPTTEEVMEKGIDLAQMNARLLEKIEELTLYMIEMKKENNAMKVENCQIKKDIELLKKVSR